MITENTNVYLVSEFSPEIVLTKIHEYANELICIYEY